MSAVDALSQVMKVGRSTRHLPRMRGLTTLVKLYRLMLPRQSRYEVPDFDGDLRLSINLRECIGVNVWHAPEQYEREERDLFCSAIHPGTVVLDIGANIGIFSLLAAKRGAHVFAIEADPENARVLRNHVARNGFEGRIQVREMAAAESDREAQLYRNPENCGGSSLVGRGAGTTVTARTIDSLGLPPIDICKMDIEGFESRALRGMRETISRSPNMSLLVEYSEPHGVEEAHQLLAAVREWFGRIQIVGGDELAAGGVPPAYCNLWCTERRRQ